MDIYGVQPPGAPRPVEPAAAVPSTPVNPASQEISDVVEISTIASLAGRIHEIPDIRVDLVQRVRQEIATGRYETPEKLEIAVNRIMDDLLGTL
jgi:negative regulator of flagellin synthesis FlgM